ncbi:Peptidase family M23 [Prosthecobacter debontii]|uniref:Peptidase family M23 n=1 Tax=Prosthecobacter debontii TaxID=48467 RepID=A0A1T4X465_9BACT|nr:M23 family metallopeptidase [Prosthecobacter debontii]SKA84237.1 Peptidase family M23 [Prosthecobacter debontii]
MTNGGPAFTFSPPRPVSWCGGLLFFGLLLLATLSQAQSTGSVRCQLADGFDFPVGKPNGDGYYKSRGYWPNGHLGEDWNGKGGGDSDLGAPIYSTARGVVIISENIGVGWGNCIIVRHAYRDETGKIAMVDSLYAHLQQRLVKVGQVMEKGQLVGTMGGNNGMYLVHLHFEMRKNLRIGMNRSQFARDNTNYYSPTDFINKHRNLQTNFQKYPIPMGLFAPYGRSLADARSDGGDTVKVPTVTPNLPDAGPSADDEDFWSKLRSRLKQSKITEGEKTQP